MTRRTQLATTAGTHRKITEVSDLAPGKSTTYCFYYRPQGDIPLDEHAKKRQWKGWTWAVVEVDLSEIDNKVERINITLPRRVLRVIDDAAKRAGESRSGYIARVGISGAK